jgi:DNA-binding CsgD family transcriptional regulator
MQEYEALAPLISDIYDATLEPHRWPDALGKAAHFVGGQAASLLLWDRVSKSTRAIYTYGSTQADVQLYCEHYAALDPKAPSLYLFDVGQVVGGTDVLPYEEFVQTRFYQEWAQPRGWIDSALVTLEKSGTNFTSMSFLRHETAGRVDEEMRRRVKLVIPHLRRAAMISNIMEKKHTEAAMFSDVFNELSAAMFFVNVRGQVIDANARGHALLTDRSPLRVANGRLAANDVAAEQALREAFLTAGRGDVAVGSKGTVVPLAAKSGDNYVAHVMPLTSGARRRTGEHYAAVAVLFVQRAQLRLPSAAPEAIAKVYGLTPSELRTLLAVVQSGGVPEAAELMGISVTTVRTHLQRVFAKTGTNRQTDLIKLVAGFFSPFTDVS